MFAVEFFLSGYISDFLICTDGLRVLSEHCACICLHKLSLTLFNLVGGYWRFDTYSVTRDVNDVIMCSCVQFAVHCSCAVHMEHCQCLRHLQRYTKSNF